MKKIRIESIEITREKREYILKVRGTAIIPDPSEHPHLVQLAGHDLGVLGSWIPEPLPDSPAGEAMAIECANVLLAAPIGFPFSETDLVRIQDVRSGAVVAQKSVSDIKTINHEIRVDSVTLEEGKFVLDGWAISAANAEVQIKSADPAFEIEQVTRYERPDVVDFVDDEHAEPASGFRMIVIPRQPRPGRKLRVTLTDGITDESHTLNLRNPRQGRSLPLVSAVAAIVPFLNRHYFNKALLILRTDGLHGLMAQLKKFGNRHASAVSYTVWIRDHAKSADELETERQYLFVSRPLISLVVPVYNTRQDFLADLIASVQAQTYADWEMIMVNGGSTDPMVDSAIKKAAAQDPRIRLLSLGKNRGISGNTNAGIELVRGEYIAFVDHDDMLDPSALFEMVKVINEKDPDMLYSDEDKFTQKLTDRFLPHFKPDFNLELFHSYNYFCHLTLIRTALVRELGGERSECDGAQDYDLFLRVVEKTDRIAHIPMILYHWRSHERSTARRLDSKSFALDASVKALGDHLKRIGRPGRIEKGLLGGTYHTQYRLWKSEKVSIIIPNKDQVDVLRRCITSILRKTTYQNYEILIIENNSTTPEIFAYYDEVAKNRHIHVLKYPGSFNYSAINNWGVEHATGDYYLLLNNDIEVISPEWLERMLEYAQYPENAVVGAKLYYPNNTLQHGGVILGIGGVAGHSHKYFPRSSPGYMGRLLVPQNLSAVTAACMLVRADAFKAVGGLDEGYAVAFNDIDFCMKITAAGYKIVWTPYAELYHHESLSRGTESTPEKIARFNREIDRFSEKWGYYLEDPNYSVNLTMDREDFSLRRKKGTA